LIASSFDSAAKADWVRAYLRLTQAAILIAIILLCLVPAAAWADVYRWVDEKGGIVFSNVQPAKTRYAKNIEVVVEEETISDTASAPVTATRSEPELLARVNRLERQLQAQQYQAPLPPPPPDHYASPYPGNYSPGSYYPSSYYPGIYYPSYYALGPVFPYVVVTTRFIRPARTLVSSRLGPGRVSSFHRGGLGRGKR